MTAALLLLLKVSVGLLILAIGMGSTYSDLAYLWRRTRAASLRTARVSGT